MPNVAGIHRVLATDHATLVAMTTTPARATGPHVAVIQHEDGCPPGLFAAWLRAAGAELDVVRPDRGEPLPTLAGDDVPHSGPDRRPKGLIVLGGSMSATDDERAPWLPATRALLRQAIASAVPTLGICLGHQLLAVATGGVVGPNPAGKQMGVLPVGLSSVAKGEHLFAEVASQAMARSVQWNSDIVVEAPPGASMLATTPEGIPQVIRIGDAAWGVQFHPEVDHGIVAAWAAEDSPVTPTEAAALADIADAADELAATWRPLAERFVEIVADSRCAATRN
jgi:GMP synthase (glutamine-hydrolysing)